MNVFVLAASAAAILSGSGVQQSSNPEGQAQVQTQAPVAELGEVEVRGRRLQEEVQSFIREVAAPPPGRNLARWDRSICVGVSNMDARYARFMIDRIARTALDVGLTVEEPGCRPDIMIVAAADAGNLAKALVADDPRGFRPATNATDRGSAALERFQSVEAPVRWWHVSLPVSVDTGEIAIGLDGEMNVTRNGVEPHIVEVREASRLRANVREDLARVVIILDVTRVGRIGFGALSDYIAMVALAQVEPDADTSSYDTVLNLFQDGADRTAGLTQWDRDYLKSLYTARRDRARPTQQARDVVRGMTGQRDMRVAEDAGD